MKVAFPAGTFRHFYTAPRFTLPSLQTSPNGTSASTVYDSVARLLTNTLLNGSSAVLDQYAYIYNPANQRTNMTRGDGSYYALGYDKIGQLVTADGSVPAESRGYAYDSAW